MEWRFCQRGAHQGAHVMIAGHAVNLKLQRTELSAKVFVGNRTVVLNQVAGDDDVVGTPLIVAVVIEYSAQRRIGHSAAQISPGVGEQVRIR